MKSTILFLISSAILFTNYTFGQFSVPPIASFQGVAKNSNGSYVAQNQIIRVTVQYQIGQNGNPFHCSVYEPTVTGTSGEFNLLIGEPSQINSQGCNGAPPANVFQNLDWAQNNIWIKIFYDPNPGSGNEVLLGTIPLSSTYYSFISDKSNKLITPGSPGQVLTYQNGNWVGAAPSGGGSQQLGYSNGNITLTNGGSVPLPTSKILTHLPITSNINITSSNTNWQQVTGTVTDSASTGIYFISGYCNYLLPPADVFLRIVKFNGNNSTVLALQQVSPLTNGAASLSVSTIANLSSGDRLRLEVLGFGGNITNFNIIGSQTNLCAFRLK